MATPLRELDIDLITRGHLERGSSAARVRRDVLAETIERYWSSRRS